MGAAIHIRFWILMSLATFLLAPLIRNQADMESYVAKELQMTRSTFGDGVSEWLAKQASVVYQMLPADSVEKAQITGKGMQRTKSIVPGPGVAVTVAFNGYVQGLVMNAFVATLRLFIMFVWLAVLAPVFIASAVDGFTQRAIKRAEFGAIRPAAFTLTSIIVVPLAMAPIIYLVIPLSVNPLIAPMWSLVMALPLALMVSNMQPMFGKN